MEWPPTTGRGELAGLLISLVLESDQQPRGKDRYRSTACRSGPSTAAWPTLGYKKQLSPCPWSRGRPVHRWEGGSRKEGLQEGYGPWGRGKPAGLVSPPSFLAGKPGCPLGSHGAEGCPSLSAPTKPPVFLLGLCPIRTHRISCTGFPGDLPRPPGPRGSSLLRCLVARPLHQQSRKPPPPVSFASPMRVCIPAFPT